MTLASAVSASRSRRAVVAFVVWWAGAGLFWWAAGPARLVWTPVVVAAAASLVTVIAFSGPLAPKTAPRCAPCALGAPMMVVTALLVYAGDPVRPSTAVTSVGLLGLGLGLARRKVASCPVPVSSPVGSDPTRPGSGPEPGSGYPPGVRNKEASR